MRAPVYGICGAAISGLIALAITAGSPMAYSLGAVTVAAAVGGILSVRYGDAFWLWLSERIRWLS